MTPPTSGLNPQPPIIILIIIDNRGGYPQFFLRIFEISVDFDSFWRKFVKFQEKSIKICDKNDEIGRKKAKFCKISDKINKKFDENLSIFWIWNGAKVCESCRSRKMLKNAYLDAKIGFDTAENEPSKVRGFLIGVGGVIFPRLV